MDSVADNVSGEQGASRLVVLLFFISSFLAFIAGHTVNYSAIMYAQDEFGSDLLAGIGFGLCFGPPLVLGWIAGVFCDRYPPGRLVFLSQGLFAVAGILLLVMHDVVPASNLKPGLYLLSTFLVGAAWAFLSPGRLAALAQVVPPAKRHQATVVFNLLIMVGFGLAPLLIDYLRRAGDWSAVFLLIAGAFILANLLLLAVKTRATSSVRTSIYREVREGVGAVASVPLLWQLLASGILVFAMLGPMQVLLPRFATSVLGMEETGRGEFLLLLAVGMIVGGILCTALASRLHPGRMILGGAALGGLSILAISLGDNILVASVALLIAGIAGGFAASLVVAGLQHEAASAVRGRVMSMYTISSQVIPAGSGLLAGVLSEALGVSLALSLAAAGILALVAVAAVSLAAVRRYHSTGGSDDA